MTPYSLIKLLQSSFLSNQEALFLDSCCCCMIRKLTWPRVLVGAMNLFSLYRGRLQLDLIGTYFATNKPGKHHNLYEKFAFNVQSL